MATKLKTLKQPEIDKLIKQSERNLQFIQTQYEPNVAKGYAQSAFEYLIKQLKGEWPI